MKVTDFSEKRRLHDLVVRLKNSYGDICDATGIQEILDYRPSVIMTRELVILLIQEQWSKIISIEE